MRRTIVAALVALLFSSPAIADERILHFVSEIQIEKDSSLDVTETIDVNVENEQINHGIFRDFPTRYAGPHGTRVSVGFTPEAVRLDGQPVQWAREPLFNGVRIKIGDPNTLVPVGRHEYSIRYRATRELGRFNDYDELYWNVTGNGWIFPIDEAEARIRLPFPVQFGQRSAYTGAQGSTASNAAVVSEGPGEIVFRTTQPLGPNEGLTVAVAFPKGVVADADQTTKLAWWLADYGPPFLGALGLIALLGFYYVAWQRAGRNPRAGTIVPLFSPPDDLSPAAMRYVVKESADNRTFAAALVDMGVKGHIKLIEEDHGWLSGEDMLLQRLVCKEPLPEEEQAALDCLCLPGSEITMQQQNHEIFSAAKSALEDVLNTRFDGKLFRRNYGWAVAGLFMFIACFWLVCAAVDVALGGVLVWQVGVVLGILITCALLWLTFHDSATGKCLLSIIGVIGVGTAIILGLPVFAEALNSGWYLPLIIPAVAAPVVLSAFSWIAAPTPEGRVVLDHIAGFKQYLSITERDQLDRMTPPADTPEVFEKYLPYAIALDVENRWAKRFAGVLAAAQAQGRQGFVWYAGSNSPWTNTNAFVNSVGSSLTSTVSSASTAPGSSSGSGGGGFSGGGGGGGGGGGW